MHHSSFDTFTYKTGAYVKHLFGLGQKVGLAAEHFQISPLKPHWQALRAASEKAARMGDFSENCSFLVAPPRFELGTQGSSGLCSTGLSYSATLAHLVYQICLR